MIDTILAKQRQGKPQSQTSQIYYYLVAQVHQAGNSRVLIPSTREIAKNFNVSRALVQRVVNSLVCTGMLEKKHGSGTYTNVSNLSWSEGFDTPASLIGMISGGGRPLFFNNLSWNILAATGSALVKQHNMVRLVTIMDLDPSSAIKELKSFNINGIVALYIDSHLHQLFKQIANSDIPVISFGYEIDGINSVVPDCEQSGYELGLRFLDEGRKKLFFGISVDHNEEYLNGFRRAYVDREISLDELLVFDDSTDFLEKLEERLQQNELPEAFFINHCHPGKIIALLKKYNVDIREQCRLFLFDDALLSVSDYCGFVRNNDFSIGSEIVAEMMQRMICNKNLSPEVVKVPVTYREIK